MASEASLLRKELLAAHILQCKDAHRRDGREAAKDRSRSLRPGWPCTRDAPSSTKSQFNHRRNKYRKKHGARRRIRLGQAGAATAGGARGARRKGTPASRTPNHCGAQRKHRSDFWARTASWRPATGARGRPVAAGIWGRSSEAVRGGAPTRTFRAFSKSGGEAVSCALGRHEQAFLSKFVRATPAQDRDSRQGGHRVGHAGRGVRTHKGIPFLRTFRFDPPNWKPRGAGRGRRRAWVAHATGRSAISA